jgi:hypothetical protein
MTTWTRHLYEHDPLSISKGESNGLSVRNIFGYQGTVGTSFIPLWENNTAYTFPTSALTMTVNSNVADDGVVIRVIGLDADYNIISGDYTLNSGTPPTTIAFFRINDVLTIDGNAANDITLTNGGTTYAKIRGGEGRNQASIFTVPANHSFYLYRIDAFSATTTGASKYVLFRNQVTLSTGVVLRVAETTFLNQMQILRQLPFKYTEKTDIEFQGRSSSGDNEISVFGEGTLVNEELDD